MSNALLYIRTPRGKRMSPKRYLALVDATNARTTGGGPGCSEGHFACAAWEGGPCGITVAIACGAYDDPESHWYGGGEDG